MAHKQNDNKATYDHSGNLVIFYLDDAKKHYESKVLAEADRGKRQRNLNDLIDFIDDMALEQERHRIAEQRANYRRERYYRKRS